MTIGWIIIIVSDGFAQDEGETEAHTILSLLMGKPSATLPHISSTAHRIVCEWVKEWSYAMHIFLYMLAGVFEGMKDTWIEFIHVDQHSVLVADTLLLDPKINVYVITTFSLYYIGQGF